VTETLVRYFFLLLAGTNVCDDLALPPGEWINAGHN